MAAWSAPILQHPTLLTVTPVALPPSSGHLKSLVVQGIRSLAGSPDLSLLNLTKHDPSSLSSLALTLPLTISEPVPLKAPTVPPLSNPQTAQSNSSASLISSSSSHASPSSIIADTIRQVLVHLDFTTGVKKLNSLPRKARANRTPQLFSLFSQVPMQDVLQLAAPYMGLDGLPDSNDQQNHPDHDHDQRKWQFTCKSHKHNHTKDQPDQNGESYIIVSVLRKHKHWQYPIDVRCVCMSCGGHWFQMTVFRNDMERIILLEDEKRRVREGKSVKQRDDKIKAGTAMEKEKDAAPATDLSLLSVPSERTESDISVTNTSTSLAGVSNPSTSTTNFSLPARASRAHAKVKEHTRQAKRKADYQRRLFQQQAAWVLAFWANRGQYETVHDFNDEMCWHVGKVKAGVREEIPTDDIVLKDGAENRESADDENYNGRRGRKIEEKDRSKMGEESGDPVVRYGNTNPSVTPAYAIRYRRDSSNDERTSKQQEQERYQNQQVPICRSPAFLTIPKIGHHPTTTTIRSSYSSDSAGLLNSTDLAQYTDSSGTAADSGSGGDLSISTAPSTAPSLGSRLALASASTIVATPTDTTTTTTNPTTATDTATSTAITLIPDEYYISATRPLGPVLALAVSTDQVRKAIRKHQRHQLVKACEIHGGKNRKTEGPKRFAKYKWTATPSRDVKGRPGTPMPTSTSTPTIYPIPSSPTDSNNKKWSDFCTCHLKDQKRFRTWLRVRWASIMPTCRG